MSDSPRVSIGLPVYNSEKYLEEALNAILGQTFSDFELVISDNASTDRTGQICSAYASRDRRIRYVCNESNLGAARNFNRVFALSRGTYFRWASYDDLIAPQTIERCVDVLDREPRVVLAYPKTTNIDADGNVLDRYEDNFAFGEAAPHMRFHSFLKRMYGHNFNALFGVIRRRVLEETTLIGSYHSSDTILLAQLVLRGEFSEVPEYLFFKRFHPEISTVVCKTEADFAAWHDTAANGASTAPLLTRVHEFIRTIHNGPLSRQQKTYCYGLLATHYLFEGKRWRSYADRAFGRRQSIAHVPALGSSGRHAGNA
jgi:glycosyltransferase involved in cell wall biosynthesis